MELDRNNYKQLDRYKKYSSASYKQFSEVVDRILSYVPNINHSSENIDNIDNNKNFKNNHTEESKWDKLEDSDNILAENEDQLRKDGKYTNKEAILPKHQTMNINGLDEETYRIKRKYDECSNTDMQPTNTSDSTESSESFGSDLIFDMKYCSLQLPIPPEVYQEEDYTLETNTSPSITEYDICYDEEVGSNYVMVEPFRFLSKVHVTFDRESGEQWCCCYFDAKGNYTKKRFNTSHIAFDTAKMLASRCREAAERSFHNIWILKHKNLLNRPIPENLTESFILIVNKIKNHLANEDCMVCCVDKIKETLHSAHKHDLK